MEKGSKREKLQAFAPINGLQMYYEIEGTGDPLVCIPPAFGYAGVNPYPALTESHTVITVDLQGHGRTADIPDRPLSIEQYAADVVGLLKYLGIAKADFFWRELWRQCCGHDRNSLPGVCSSRSGLRSNLWPS
jgi:hypothetical protein